MGFQIGRIQGVGELDPNRTVRGPEETLERGNDLGSRELELTIDPGRELIDLLPALRGVVVAQGVQPPEHPLAGLSQDLLGDRGRGVITPDAALMAVRVEDVDVECPFSRTGGGSGGSCVYTYEGGTVPGGTPRPHSLHLRRPWLREVAFTP